MSSLNLMLLLMLLLMGSWESSSAARILAFLPLPWRSHQNIFRPLMRALALKGHQVDFYTPLPMQNPPANLNQFVVTDLHEMALLDLRVDKFLTGSHFELQIRMCKTSLDILEKTFTNDQVSIDLLKSNKTYDAVITEFPVFSEAVAYMAHKFKAPSIAILGYFDHPWVNELSGLPDNPSYMTTYANPVNNDNMDFRERLRNFFTTTEIVLSAALTTLTMQQSWADKILRYEGWESRPKIMEMMSETALYLIDSHVSVGPPYPKAPHVKEIAGTHIDPQPLPKDLQDFMDDAPHGVILFSMGSILNPDELLTNRKTLLKVFKSLKQKVLWKIKDGSPPVTDDPKIRVQKWFPQQGVLYHKNMRLFITHGGLQSTIEAISAGVPCLGMPVLFDQEKDVAFMVKVGMALKLAHYNVTEHSFHWFLNEMLTNPKYSEQAKKQQAVFHDRPVKPVDEAVYWIEYVLRHGNILRPASASMPFYKLYLLDIFGFIFACFVLSVWVLCRAIRVAMSLLRRASGNSAVPSRKKTN